MLEGVYIACITPFNEKLEVDRGVLREHLEYLSRSKVDGLYLCGTTGQGPLLSMSEKLVVVEECLKIFPEDKLIVHIGGLDFKEVLDFGKKVLKMGVEQLALQPPYYYRYDEKAVREYYKKVYEEVGTPLIVYNIPSTTNVNISVETMVKLEEEGVICGVKESSGKLDQVLELKENLKSPVLNGPDDLHYQALACGVDGLISGVGNIVPDMIVEIYKKFKSGLLREALETHSKISKLRSTINNLPPVAPYHVGLEILGRRGGRVKPPLRMLNEDEVGILRNTMRILGIL